MNYSRFIIDIITASGIIYVTHPSKLNGAKPENCKLWKPKKDEWCVFYDNKDSLMVVRKYFGTNEPYRYVAPLEFIQTLKDT